MPRLPIAPALVAATILLTAAHAQASGIASARFGGEHGTPVSTNPTAIYYNPAALAESKGVHVFLDATVLLKSTTYKHTTAPTDEEMTATKTRPFPPTAMGANTDKANLFNVAAIPMIGASAKLGDFAIGGGLYIPFGGTTSWQKNSRFQDNPYYAGLVDGSQRWYSIDGTLGSYYLTLSAAYKIPNTGLSIGVSGNRIKSFLYSGRARTPEANNDTRTEGRSVTDVAGWQWGFGVGAMYEAIRDRFWIGASYQSRPNVSGGMKLKGTLRNVLLNGQDNTDQVYLYQDMPDIYRLGVKIRVRPDVEVRVFGDYTRWSALNNQCIRQKDPDPTRDESLGCDIRDDGSAVDPSANIVANFVRRWKDAFGVRASVSYWVMPEVEIMGGLGFDSSAIPDRTLDPTFTDYNKFNGSIGTRLQVFKNLYTALTYTQFVYLSRDTTGKSWHDRRKPPSKGPDAGGEYSSVAGMFNVNAEFVF